MVFEIYKLRGGFIPLFFTIKIMIYNEQPDIPKGVIHEGNSSSSAKLPKYRKPGFWYENKFWLDGSYTPEAIKYFEEEFLPKTREGVKFGDPVSNLKNIK